MGWNRWQRNRRFLQLPVSVAIPLVHGVAEGPGGATAQDAFVVYYCFSRVMCVEAIFFREVSAILLYRQDMDLVDDVSIRFLDTSSKNCARVSRECDVETPATGVIEAQ